MPTMTPPVKLFYPKVKLYSPFNLARTEFAVFRISLFSSSSSSFVSLEKKKDEMQLLDVFFVKSKQEPPYKGFVHTLRIYHEMSTCKIASTQMVVARVSLPP